jgi:hypothetical protein
MNIKNAKTNTAPADNLGAMIDRAWTYRAARLEAQRDVDRLKEKEDEMHAEIGAALRKAKLQGGKGVLASAGFRRTQVAQVVDEEAFLAWGKLKANRDCLKAGVVGEAWRLRLAEGVEVPGVEAFLKETVVLSKAGG